MERAQALEMRVTKLKERFRGARITENEMQIFQRVAALLDDGRGRIDPDDLIAASFVAETPGDLTSN
jgi:hypothetical protein